MAKILRDIKVSKIDLVGLAANRRKITLFKAADTKGGSVKADELSKAVKELSDDDRAQLLKDLGVEPPKEVDLITAVKALDEEKLAEFMKAIAPPDVLSLVKALDEKKRAELMKALETPNPDDLKKDDNLTDEQKAAIELLQKDAADRKEENKKLAERLEKAETERQREKFIKAADEYTPLPEWTADDCGEILMKCSNALEKEEYERLTKVLAGSAVIVKESEHFKEIGQAGGGSGSARQEQLKKAEELMKSDSSLTKEQARMKVLEMDDGLAVRVRAEEKGGK